jgi:hypothetical protein
MFRVTTVVVLCRLDSVFLPAMDRLFSLAGEALDNIWIAMLDGCAQ